MDKLAISQIIAAPEGEPSLDRRDRRGFEPEPVRGVEAHEQFVAAGIGPVRRKPEAFCPRLRAGRRPSGRQRKEADRTAHMDNERIDQIIDKHQGEAELADPGPAGDPGRKPLAPQGGAGAGQPTAEGPDDPDPAHRHLLQGLQPGPQGTHTRSTSAWAPPVTCAVRCASSTRSRT